MKFFLDTNVIIDYLAKRQPFAVDACQRDNVVLPEGT